LLVTCGFHAMLPADAGPRRSHTSPCQTQALVDCYTFEARHVSPETPELEAAISYKAPHTNAVRSTPASPNTTHQQHHWRHLLYEVLSAITCMRPHGSRNQVVNQRSSQSRMCQVLRRGDSEGRDPHIHLMLFRSSDQNTNLQDTQDNQDTHRCRFGRVRIRTSRSVPPVTQSAGAPCATS
jgi:hypothetical protein